MLRTFIATISAAMVLSLGACQVPGQHETEKSAAPVDLPGRYQMGRIGNDGTQVYVLDTKEGYLTYCATSLSGNTPECGPKTAVQ